MGAGAILLLILALGLFFKIQKIKYEMNKMKEKEDYDVKGNYEGTEEV